MSLCMVQRNSFVWSDMQSLRGLYCVLPMMYCHHHQHRYWFSTPWLSVCVPSGALNPLSAVAAAAAAAGRVALAGQTGCSGVLLVSNLNEEVSNTDTSNTSKMESLQLKLHRSYTPPPFICFCFFCCSLWVSFSISRFVFLCLSLKMCIKNSCLTLESVNRDNLLCFCVRHTDWTHSLLFMNFVVLELQEKQGFLYVSCSFPKVPLIV